MEKSYGIEAARAQLGDIADHVRTTGEVVDLTRHGRTVAVIGPAKAVRQAQGVKVLLHFPHRTVGSPVHMPAVPRKGEFVSWEDPEHGDGQWHVTEVEYVAFPDELGTIGIVLEPIDEEAKRQTEK